MAKKLKFGNVILCDHVAQGEKNKVILINVYSGDMIVEEFPASIILGLFCEYIPSDLDEIEIQLDILLDKTPIGKIAGKVKPSVVGEVGSITIPQFPVTVPNATRIRVIAKADGYSSSEILNKRIFKHD